MCEQNLNLQILYDYLLMKMNVIVAVLNYNYIARYIAIAIAR